MISIFTALLMSRIWGMVASKLTVAEVSSRFRSTFMEAEL